MLYLHNKNNTLQFKMKYGSRAQVLHGTVEKTSSGMTAEKLTVNKNGKVVSKEKSKQAKKNFGKNLQMKLHSQAVKEVSKGRNDKRDLFVKNSNINKDIKKRYHELLRLNDLPIQPVRRASKTGKKRARRAIKRKAPTKKLSNRAKKGGWFY